MGIRAVTHLNPPQSVQVRNALVCLNAQSRQETRKKKKDYLVELINRAEEEMQKLLNYGYSVHLNKEEAEHKTQVGYMRRKQTSMDK